MDHMLWLEPSICEDSWGQNHSYKLVSSGYESPTDHIDKFRFILFGNEEIDRYQTRGARDIPDIIRTWFWKDTQPQGGRKTGGMLGRGEVGGSAQGLRQEFRQTNHNLNQDSTRSKKGERQIGKHFGCKIRTWLDERQTEDEGGGNYYFPRLCN